MPRPADHLGHRDRPGPRRHQADRRGVGRRRPVPGRRRSPATAGPSGTAGSATTSAVRQGRPGHGAGRRASGSWAAPTSTAARDREPAADHQLRDLPRRLHAQRPRLVRRQAQRGERRGQPRRHRRQPQLELRRRGPDRRPGDRGAARPAGQEPADARAARRSACRCCSMGDEVRRTQRGNNNAYCQDNELTLVRLGPRRAQRRPPALHAAGSSRPAVRRGSCSTRRRTSRLASCSAGRASSWTASRLGQPDTSDDSRVDRARAVGRAHRAAPHPERVLGGARLRAAGRGRGMGGWRRIVDTSLAEPGRPRDRGRCAARSRTAAYRAGPRSVVVLAAAADGGAAVDDVERADRAPDVAAAWNAQRMAAPGPPRGGPRLGQPVVPVGPVRLASAPGARSARTTAPTATRGRRSRTTTPARAPTAGTRTGWPASPTSSAGCAWRSRCGTAATRSSRSGCSGSRTARATTARTSRSTGGTSTRVPSSALAALALPLPAGGLSRTSDLIEENARRSKLEPEFELLDTGHLRRRPLLDRRGRLRARPTRPTSWRGSRSATPAPRRPTLHVLPTLWFRNEWSWDPAGARPAPVGGGRRSTILASHPVLGDYELHVGPGAGRDAARAPVLRERDQRRAAVRPAADDAVAQGRHQRPRRRRRRDRQPGRRRARRRRAWYRLTVAARRRPPRSGSGCARARRRVGPRRGRSRADLLGAAFDGDDGEPRGRGRRVLRRPAPRRRDRRRGA